MPNITVKAGYFTGTHNCDQLLVTGNLDQPYGEKIDIPLSLYKRITRIQYEWIQVQIELKKITALYHKSDAEVPF